MEGLFRTPLHGRHTALGAVLVDFGGWEMPLHYPSGILEEHLATRAGAGLFDVSHMGRFAVSGPGALAFLQHALTNHAAALDPGLAQYTLIPDAQGGAVDDAYLYRFRADEYLLVVNAANRAKDWDHLQGLAAAFSGVTLTDRTGGIAMLALQGPGSRAILQGLLTTGALPDPLRNALAEVSLAGLPVPLSRTGYTGEPLGFELFPAAVDAPRLWDLLREGGAVPVGLGARDTLRIEAGLPLYGRELGRDPAGAPIPLFACGPARAAVSFSPLKGDFVGRVPLAAQAAAFRRLGQGDATGALELPRLVYPFALTGRGVARAGFRVLQEGREVGVVTSGTMVPYWETAGEGLATRFTGGRGMRAIGLMLADSRLAAGEAVAVEIRGSAVPALVVPWHLRADAPPRAMPILAGRAAAPPPAASGAALRQARALVEEAVANHRWRQEACINLIPSEQTPSPLVRRLTILDPMGRYAEHRPLHGFYDAEVFYYQGTDFIAACEARLAAELARYLGCREVETRLISGQMANAAVFSALVDHVNRGDRRSEPRRFGPVLNHPIVRGGHLSAQPLGALRDFVRHDPRRERPAVVPFPVLPENPYRIDVAATRRLIAETRPELVILGKSMVLHPEPVREIREALAAEGVDALLLYDAAHVLGLLGPHFQAPFREGADLVTGSTHKTFFGTQRGIAAGNWAPGDPAYSLWESVRSRTFPGSVSNHHLGTLLGLLMAVYEMNAFGDAYQRAVLANARAFARALADAGLSVAGDPAAGYTETHQVILRVAYGEGVAAARRLEEAHILCNFQAAPDEEGFTAAGALRLGVQEMTRFGMGPGDFAELAGLLRDALAGEKGVREAVTAFRKRFLTMGYRFAETEVADRMADLHRLI